MMMASPRSGLLASELFAKKKMGRRGKTVDSAAGSAMRRRARSGNRKPFDNGVPARKTSLRNRVNWRTGTIQQVFVELLRVRQLTPEGFCLLALGGYGREMLFPYSDLDLLFLFGNEKAEEEFRPLIADFSNVVGPGFSVSSAAHAGRVPAN